MKNIPDPKYKIGDVVIFFDEQMKIIKAYYSKEFKCWKYNFENNHLSSLEDQIIKKLN